MFLEIVFLFLCFVCVCVCVCLVGKAQNTFGLFQADQKDFSLYFRLIHKRRFSH